MHDEGTEISPELIELMQKVGGQEYSRLAFEQLVGPPEIDVVALTLMQKTASVADLELFKAAERACPGDPIQLYEELGGQYKLGAPDEAQQRFDAAYDDVEQAARPISRGTLGGMALGAGGGALLAHLLHSPQYLPMGGSRLPNPHMGGALLGGAMLGGTIGNRIGHAFTDKPAYHAALSKLEAAEAGLNEKQGGVSKLAGPGREALQKAKGLGRVGELLSGSRASGLKKGKEVADRTAVNTFDASLKHDPSKVTPRMLKATHEGTAFLHPAKGGLSAEERDIVHTMKRSELHHLASTRSGRLGKVLSAEESKVKATRGVAAAGVAGGAVIGHKIHKDSDK